jgi:hypothetical protein
MNSIIANMPTIKKQASNAKIIIKTSESSKYMSSLTELERKTFEIAKSHLGSSFNMKRSIGFLNWKERQ